jgi:hypothetical protein
VFNRLFVRSDALTRQLSAPLMNIASISLNARSRERPKAPCVRKGRTLLSMANYRKLAYRPSDQINFDQIEKSASRSSRKKYPSPSKRSREEFYAVRRINFVLPIRAFGRFGAPASRAWVGQISYRCVADGPGLQAVRRF